MRLTGIAPPTKDAVEAVLNILRSCPEGSGASTKEIFHRAKPIKPSHWHWRAAPPPNPVRSVTYLKDVVLQSLRQKGVIEKVHVKPATNSVDSESTDEVTEQVLEQFQPIKRMSAGALQPIDTWIWRSVVATKSAAKGQAA
ncbi:hypothetical protein EW145_g6559 [Phellinidium pouzarii]|uniref:Uncharacterized protein n=1 Tax=Phellinidium pouzarii TaxID=167371 RepID=A0A4S4KWF3_9AGAM|nr:hypothetical protein EW145_g6559 [Phellinidium pouzarii]